MGWSIVKYDENVGELNRVDVEGKWIKWHFATLLVSRV